ncbi:hypothetical protein [Cellulomonas endometrii]|uniref:hypothetical protein n=1 Tax=Cellulomonas endometrii TaxID=3036301 RepID=UPI0024ADF610|nr:hypothetical protein [Cellulomonas endometrii]
MTTTDTTRSTAADHAVSPNDHRAWCDTAECFLGHDSDGDYASHYGHPRALAIDASDAGEWRSAPEGAPEITIRPIDFMGHVGVELNGGDTRTYSTTSGSHGVSWLTADETKDLGHQLIATARLIEAGSVEMGQPDEWDVEHEGTRHRWTNSGPEYSERFQIDTDEGSLEVKPQVYERVDPTGASSVRLPMVTVGDFLGLTAEQALVLADELIRYATHLTETEEAARA